MSTAVCPIYTLRLESRRPGRAVHDLRALLKRLLRQHGFVCIDAREIANTHEATVSPSLPPQSK